MPLPNMKETQKSSITVGFLYEVNKERLKLKNINGGVGFDKEIHDKNIHRPGLALAGFIELFTYDRVQIFGNTEMQYLNHLSKPERIIAFETILRFNIPCIIITSDNVLEDDLIRIATDKKVAVFQTPFETTKLVYFLGDFLDDQFSPQTVLHGSFIDVYGVGVLLTGRSGIGKSEVALDLVERGHRLVADDVVTIVRKGEGILIGTGSDVVKHFMEIRGLGLVDVRAIFGIRSIRHQKRIEIIVELEDWKQDEEYTRTGLEHGSFSILNVPLPHIKLPIFPGKNITVIVEVVALDYLLKRYGYDAAKAFARRLDAAIAQKTKGNLATDYFEHDFE
ncbi:MAG TPA: HPr(Ser) kinase/phosphatase [Bacteroidota bacterium]|nr:HPr(Ser) kinase/phosphatase [Bacteroidota bacterium]